MADQPQAPQATQQARPGPPILAASKKPVAARAAAAVANHAYLALAALIVLTVLVIGLYVYYHGFLALGPYASRRDRLRAKKKKNGGAADPDEKGDPETERLIDAINQQ